MSDTHEFYTAEQISQRQSISTLVFRGYRPIGEGALEELARHGLRTIELLESREQFDLAHSGSMALLGQACRATGIALGAYHAHITNFTDLGSEAARQERVDFCRRQIDTMLELGGQVWGCHAQDADATMVACYRDLLRHVEGTNAIVAVENFTAPGVGVEDRIAFLDSVDHPQLGMILDIGHVRDSVGRNPMTEPGGPTRILDLCGHRLRHIHLHGFIDGRDHHPPMADGDGIQWLELFKALHRVGYPGHLNFEPQGDPVHARTLELTAQMPQRLAALAAGS